MTDLANHNEAPAAPASPGYRWVAGALRRGFYAVAQIYCASTLSALLALPRIPGVMPLTSIDRAADSFARRIAVLERLRERNDIDPQYPNRAKSVLGFLLYYAAYLAPTLAIGFGFQFVIGPMTGLVAAGLLNTYAMLGEALMQTSSKCGIAIAKTGALRSALADDEFRCTARNNALIKGSICGAFTLAAGPLAIMLGSFTNETVAALTRTPVGAYLSEQFIKATQHSAFKSANNYIGKIFANAAIGNGRGIALLSGIGEAINSVSVVRGAAAAACITISTPQYLNDDLRHYHEQRRLASALTAENI